MNAKSKRMDAERAAVWFAHKVMNCVITRRAIKTQWQSVDFFGSDVVGKRNDGSHVYIQATAGMDSAVSARKKKLEKIPWHKSDQVLLIQLKEIDNSKPKQWEFKVIEYKNLKWEVWTINVKILREWFKAYKTEEE